LQKGNTLNINTEIINRGNADMPLQDGWHPYFTFGGTVNNLELKFQAREKVEFNDKMIPTGKFLPFDSFLSFKKIGNEKFDDCFVLNFSENVPACVLRDVVQKIQLEIKPDKTYPYLQIYTPDHRESIAIENLSAPPDTFNNGISLIELAAGKSARFHTSFKITSLI
jgi:aldose 1-epimerase